MSANDMQLAPWSQDDTFDFGAMAAPGRGATPPLLRPCWIDEGYWVSERSHGGGDDQSASVWAHGDLSGYGTGLRFPGLALLQGNLSTEGSPAGHDRDLIGAQSVTVPFPLDIKPVVEGVADGSGVMDAKTAGGGGGKPGGGGSGGGTVVTSYVSGDSNVADSNEFNIRLEFTGTWTAKQQAIVIWAAELLSDIIVADVRDDTDLSGRFVDDIVITMGTGRIDGSGNPLLGNTLAQTQIMAVRDPGSFQQWIPVTSSITLDSTDLKNSVSGGWSAAWDDVVLHEMIHALGFSGVVFDGLNLVDAAGNFIGVEAMAAYGGAVPVESGGTSATAGSHWSETGFAPGGTAMATEIMTGYLGTNQQTQVSDTTLGALADLGYTIQDPSIGSYFTVNSGLLLV